ncbi:MAG: sulfatase-like hydrolase/transferase [Planctomycetota bacterium]|nr:sulfatase-like hydrolase/transferase [Planctomycetota bacterium]
MAAALAASGLRAAETAPRRRLNVLLIVADDLGAGDLGSYGCKDIATPNLDALAAGGVRFTQFYVNAPICSPSRAALLTGRYPQRAGLVTNASAGKAAMPGDQFTLAEALRGAGYRTALFGKWHLGRDPGTLPRDQGFDEFFGHLEGCTDNYSHFYFWSGPNRHDQWRNETENWEQGKYFPDLLVREATRFLDENRQRPFFLYFASNLPHYPLQGEEKFRKMYEALTSPRREYAALVSTLDEKVGEVLAKVDALGLRESTLVIFLSDNGHSLEERTGFGGGSGGPYRGEKFSLLEGGIRLPCIVRLPGQVPAGQVRGSVAAAMDFFPTVLDLCGVELPPRKLDGKSLTPMIASDAAPPLHPVLHWQTGNHWAVRDGDWKLVVNAPAIDQVDKTFLANLATDPGEAKNLAAEKPEIVARLTAMHEAWAKEVTEQ